VFFLRCLIFQVVTRWQATLCFGFISMSSGSSLKHFSHAKLHLVLNLHPEGGFNGEGNSPCAENLSHGGGAKGSGCGIASIKALVYGCMGLIFSVLLTLLMHQETKCSFLSMFSEG